MWAVKAHEGNQQFVGLFLTYDSIQSESNADEPKTQKQHIEASGCSRNNLQLIKLINNAFLV